MSKPSRQGVFRLGIMRLLTVVLAGCLSAQVSGALLAWHVDCEHHCSSHEEPQGDSTSEQCATCSLLTVLNQGICVEATEPLGLSLVVEPPLPPVRQVAPGANLDASRVRGPPVL